MRMMKIHNTKLIISLTTTHRLKDNSYYCKTLLYPLVVPLSYKVLSKINHKSLNKNTMLRHFKQGPFGFKISSSRGRSEEHNLRKNFIYDNMI